MATVDKVQVVTPFGVLVGETYPFPSVEFYDADGGVVDPSMLTTRLKRWSQMGEESEMAGSPVGDVVEFPWPAGDTDADTTWQTMVEIDDGVLVYSLATPNLNVYDPMAMYCTVTDVEMIVGRGVYSQWEILAAIQVAESVVRAWVTTPIGPPVPTRVRTATALMAARVLTSVSDGDGSAPAAQIIEERIADYSVRYADGASAGSPWLIDGEVAELLLPWKPRTYSTNIAEPRAATEDIDDGYLPLIGGF